MLKDCCIAFTRNLQLLFQPLGPNQCHCPSAPLAQDLRFTGSSLEMAASRSWKIQCPGVCSVQNGQFGTEFGV